jgi:hypothetical protein
MSHIINAETASLIKSQGFPQEIWDHFWCRAPGMEDWILLDKKSIMATMETAAAPTRTELFNYIQEYGDERHDNQLTTAFALTAMFVSLEQQEKERNVEDRDERKED